MRPKRLATWVLGSSFTLLVSGEDTGSFFLNFSSSAPHILATTASLLHQWPNTFFPNGHAIAAGTVEPHTLLYHGRHDGDMPSSPEWLAFDREMAYGIMGSLPDSRLLTYRTIRRVGIVYFDGMSANLMSRGIESQMTFLYGDSKSVPKHPDGSPGRPQKPPGRPPQPPGKQAGSLDDDGLHNWNPLDDEYFRAKGLCSWIHEHDLGGRGWGIEGVVRMNAGFELIWCDFESPSLRLVSNINVSTPQLEKVPFQKPVVDGMQRPLTGSDSPEGPHGPGMTDPREPFRGVANWMWFAAATRRYGSSGTAGTGPGRGEARASVNTCGLFTFYHPRLQGQAAARIESERESLNISSEGRWNSPEDQTLRMQALEQLMRRRRFHRTNNVTKEDGAYMRALVGEGLRAAIENNESHSDTGCSGVDWQLTAQEIMVFYGNNLKSLRDLLLEAPIKLDRDWLRSVRSLTHWLIMSFFEYPPKSHTGDDIRDYYSIDSPAAVEAISRCTSQYRLEDEAHINEGEQNLSWAIEETLRGICHSIFRVGLDVELKWLLHFNNDQALKELTLKDSQHRWRVEVEELMAWLGWIDLWTGCEGPCESNELCYIPMWPTINDGMWRHGPRESLHDRDRPWGSPDRYLWQPMCVNISSFGAM